MVRRAPATLLVLALLAMGVLCHADSIPATRGAKVGKSTLDPENIRRALQTANPDEEIYIAYICALMNQGVLPSRIALAWRGGAWAAPAKATLPDLSGDGPLGRRDERR